LSLLCAAVMAPMAVSAADDAEVAGPERLYAIGDFNDWALPADGNDNGAIPIELSEGTPSTYWEDMDIPAGTREFMFCYTSPATGNTVYMGSTLPSFTLYKYAMGVSCIYEESENREELHPFTLRGWAGSRIMSTIYMAYGTVNFGALDGVMYQSPGSEMYALFTIENAQGTSTELLTLTSDQYDPAFGTLTFDTSSLVWDREFLEHASKVSLIFTTEQSVTPDPATCWGEVGRCDAVVPGQYNIAVGPGGQAFEFDLPGEGYTTAISVDMNLQNGLASVSRQTEALPGYFIYLIGTPQGWDINSAAMPLSLKPGTTGVYEATYFIGEGEGMFRFYNSLGDWDTGSIGVREADEPSAFTFASDGTIETCCLYGKGSWELADWEGGEVYMRVDLENWTILFKTDRMINGISGPEVNGEESATVWYDLQGAPVSHPVKGGIYIKVTDKGSAKVVY
ncbi:MAG: hypothetical protein K2H21_10220, partial [Muribaculaceae bacterium]|nr:hypothetical protein [Muribaculaceae bacterium]